jgi:hypothetical protein
MKTANACGAGDRRRVAPQRRAAGALTAAQAVRLRLEERALASAFPDYARYARGEPRLLPSPVRLLRDLRGGGVSPPVARPAGLHSQRA